MESDIKYRCYHFSLAVIKFLRAGHWDSLSLVIVKQLMRSASSVGADVTEARNSSTRLCLLRDGFETNNVIVATLLKEADEISKILAASVIKLKHPLKESSDNKQ